MGLTHSFEYFHQSLSCGYKSSAPSPLAGGHPGGFQICQHVLGEHGNHHTAETLALFACVCAFAMWISPCLYHRPVFLCSWSTLIEPAPDGLPLSPVASYHMGSDNEIPPPWLTKASVVGHPPPPTPQPHFSPAQLYLLPALVLAGPSAGVLSLSWGLYAVPSFPSLPSCRCQMSPARQTFPDHN